MFKVKLNLAKLTVLAKIAKAKQVVTDMTANVNFTTPFPALASITTAANELETAQTEAAEGGKGKNAVMRVKEKAMDSLLTAESSYVNYASNGEEYIILSSGFEARPNHSPALPIPDPPFAVQAKSSLVAGQLLITFKTHVRSLLYRVEESPASVNGNVVTNSWTLVGLTSRRSLLATGLNGGAYYAFRVAAISASGQSEWSEIAIGKVAF